MIRKMCICFAPHFKILVILLFVDITISISQPTVGIGNQSVIANTSADDRVKELVQQVLQRKGYSNPSANPDEAHQEVKKSLSGLTRPPPVKIDNNFDPNKSYVFKGDNGQLTYIFPASTEKPTTVVSIGSESLTTTTSDITLSSGSDEINLPTPSDYPYDEINDFLSQHQEKYSFYFGNDFISNDSGDQLNIRFGKDETYNFLCDSEVKMTHYKYLTSIENKNEFIVNTELFKQGVSVEKCIKPNQTCSKCYEKTQCVQTYSHRKLLTFNVDAKKTSEKIFQLPSACKCAKSTQ